MTYDNIRDALALAQTNANNIAKADEARLAAERRAILDERKKREQERVQAEQYRIDAIHRSESPNGEAPNAYLDGVLSREMTGCDVRRKAIHQTYDDRMLNHREGYSRLDFHDMPFDGRILYLPAFLNLLVGDDYPHFDFARSMPSARHYAYVSHRGPVDPKRWNELLPAINRYLGGAWRVQELDGTTIELSPLPNVPEVIPVDIGQLRKGNLFPGVDLVTALPYYVPFGKLSHVLVGGRSGAGKSVLLNHCLLSLLFNLDQIDELVLIDLKGGVELSRYKGLSPKIRFIRNYDDLHAVVEGLVGTMTARFEALEQRGELSVKTGFIFVIIDEFAAIQQRTFRAKEDKERHAALIANLNLLAQQSRAAGIRLWAQLQKPTADNMDTNFRTNLQSVVCFNMPLKANAAAMFGDLEGLPGDPTRLGKGEFIFMDDGQNRIVRLKSPMRDETDTDLLKACVHPDCRTSTKREVAP